LAAADTVVGYGTYVDLIRPLVKDKEVIRTGMTKEVERVAKALDTAMAGKSVALVSSGDPGIYAMAGLAFEICARREMTVIPPGTKAADGNDQAVFIEVVPGIPALCAGAALLGAPLTHDFAAISLSDLMTPWEVIEKRIIAAAQADFVMVIYNPKSRKRNWQLKKTQEIVLSHRNGHTPVGIVTAAMRPGQQVHITTLDQLHLADVNMQTTVFIGNSNTKISGEFMFTPRGYGEKYKIS
jgi:precorrin-3B C17-methyltransferase